MIFVWATCLAGIAKSPPWPPDLAIQREWLAETKTNAEVWDLLSADNPHLPQPAIGLTNHGIQMWQIRHLTL